MAHRVDLPPYVSQAHYGKRFFGYLIDMVAIFLGMAAIYGLLGRNVILPAFGYDDLVGEKTALLTETKMTQGEDASWEKLSYPAKGLDGYGYQRYAERVWYYCTEVLPNDESWEMNPNDFELGGDYDYVPFAGNRAMANDVGKWTYDNFFATLGMGVYEPVKDDSGNPDYTKMPELTSSYLDNIDSVCERLMSKFHNSAATGSYDDAYKHLFDQSKVVSLDNSIDNARWLSYLPAILVSPLIFNFIIPLLFPKGKSIGKLLLGTSVVSTDGFVASKGKLAIHYGLITVCYAMLAIRNYLIAFIAFQLVMLVFFSSVALSGNMQGLHDGLAGTVVVDDKQSKVFRTIENRAHYAETHPDSDVADWLREKTADQFMEQYGDRVDYDE